MKALTAMTMLMGVTTRYWDCCKPSCGWPGKAKVNRPVETCSKDNVPLKGYDTKSGCEGGGAFACDEQSPFVVSANMSYGFAAAKLKGQVEADWCCKCYELTFRKEKKMIVQITNTGWDLGENHFDLQIPGGGQGLFKGCEAQYGLYKGGELYGGVKNKKECGQLPKRQRRGCLWRFEWFENADNPRVRAKEVDCPKRLTDISKCVRVRV